MSKHYRMIAAMARRILVTMTIIAAIAAPSMLRAQTDGTIPNVRQRMLVFGANGFIAAGPDTTTLPTTIARSVILE